MALLSVPVMVGEMLPCAIGEGNVQGFEPDVVLR
jgi:hypothetical protein